MPPSEASVSAQAPPPRYQTLFETPSDLELVVTRTFDAPRSLVWTAFTDPKHLPNWQPERSTMPVCEIDLRPGGSWRYVYRLTGGREVGVAGTYREVDPPKRFVQVMNVGADE